MELSSLNILIPLKNNNGLLHNTISQRTLVLEKKEINSIKKLNSCKNIESEIPYSLFLKLSKIKAVTSSAREQIKNLEKSDFSLKQSTSKISITVMMTEACNFGCKYCNQGLEKQTGYVDETLIRQITDYLLSLNPVPNKLEITWYGGEPLLRSKEIIKSSNLLKNICEKNNIEYHSTTVTNGYFLKGKLSQDLYEAGISISQISIDGDQKTHDASRYVIEGNGTYERIMNNIKDSLESSNMNIVIRVNTDRRNYKRLNNLIDDLYKRGIFRYKNFHIYFAHVYDPKLNMLDNQNDVKSTLLSHVEFAKIQFDMGNYVKKLKGNIAIDLPAYKGDCIASLKQSFAIRPDGTLFKCYIPIANPEESFGTIKTIKESFESKNFKKWNSWKAFHHPNCNGCKLLGSCRGSCRFNYVSESYKNEEFKCPPSKYYANEYIFQKAVSNGLVNPEDWDKQISKTNLENLRF
tara:strand:+ start:1749 stop:3140 length:1392 start_codon:yes stop_codon:yes gene_type:complete